MAIEDYSVGRSGAQLVVRAEDYAHMTSGPNAPRGDVEYRTEHDIPRGEVLLDADQADYVVHNTDEDLEGAWVPISRASARAHDYLVAYDPDADDED